MQILITGSRGYIGCRLCELISKSHKKLKIVGLDTNFYNFNKKIEKKFLNKDLRDISLKDLKNIDAIIHLASLSNDPLGSLNKNLTIDVNDEATLKIAKLSKMAGAKRFIFISTQSVYGISKNLKKTIRENSKNIKPITQYAISKFKAEKKILKLASNNFCVTILRPSTVHGPSKNFRSDIVLNNLCGSAYTEKEIIIKTNGLPYRPILFIDDLCKIIISCLYKNKKVLNRQIFNVGYTNKNYQIIQIGKLVKKVFKKTQIKVLNQPSHDERSYKVNFDKISKTFSDVINFKKKNVLQDIKKIKKFFIKEKFTKKKFKSERTNRVLMLKKLIKNKKLNKNLRVI